MLLQEHLEDVEFAEFEHFLEKVWPNIKQFYKSPGSEEEAKGDNSVKKEDTEPVKVNKFMNCDKRKSALS